MGLLDGAIGLLNDIKMITSDDPFISGLRFEEFVNELFSEKYYSLIEKTHSSETNKERYVESSMNPDFVFRHNPSRDLFAVECKYRTNLNNGVLDAQGKYLSECSPHCACGLKCDASRNERVTTPAEVA